MKATQEGKCAICGEVPDHDLRVDHDHGTKKVRELLCATCNSGLGHFHESQEKLQAAIAYLKKHKQEQNSNDMGA